MWNEKEIDEVEDVYIGMWNSGVGASKLKVFIDSVRRFLPHVVIESIEHIAKTQDRDIRPSISTITQVCRDKSPREPIRRQPSPCDNGDDDGGHISFRDHYRNDRSIKVPAFMHKFLDDDDPRKTNGKSLDDSPDTADEQQEPADALGGASEGQPRLASRGRSDLRKRKRARTDTT